MRRNAWLAWGVLSTALFAFDAQAQISIDDPASRSLTGLAPAGCAPTMFLFGDDFEIGTPCRWKPVQGWSGFCLDRCGDCNVTAGEACDDGNQASETECPYGSMICTRCDATCAAELQLAGPFCGDGTISPEHGEQCDDGNLINESECPYGVAVCVGCSTSCESIPGLAGAVCGDGSVSPAEESCDDGNTSACGTCSSDCRALQNPAAASGMLVVPAGTGLDDDNDTFSLNDGLGAPVVFEFDRDGDGVAPGNVAILVTGGPSESTVRNAVIGAINAQVALGITASAFAAQIVSLVNDAETSAGNVPIVESVTSPSFVAFGMSGGRAGDCGNGVACASGADCLSGVCSSQICSVP